MGAVTAHSEHSEAAAEPMTFETIYEQHLPYVMHSLRRLGVRDSDREDLTHDVFVVVHRRLHTYDRERPLTAWLFGIAFRLAADYRRSARFRREVIADPIEGAPAFPDTADLADELVAAAQRRALLLAALDELELERRAVLILHDLDGRTIPEIRQVIDAPENTLYSHLRRARRELARAVQQLSAQGDAR